MTTDTSENFQDTWGKLVPFFLTGEFLDRRLKDVQSFGEITSNISEYISFTTRSLRNIANSRGMRL